MYTKLQIQQKLTKKGHDIDIDSVKKYLKSWKIDPLYEDEAKEEYFDEQSVLELEEGINLKKQGKNDREIISVINKEVASSANVPVDIKATVETNGNTESKELRNVTVDITSQTLALLAESIAQKITTDITDRFKEEDFIKPILDAAKLKRDNEIMADQVAQLLEENRRLVSKVTSLQENSKFKPIFSSLYMKIDL